jgi:hypothetical protein
MPLPMLEHNWQFNVNQAIPWTTSRLNTKRMLLMALKRSMTEVPSNPWQIVRSSDASAVSNTDRWGTDLSKLNWNYSGSYAKSWAIFRQPAIAAQFDVLVWLEDDAGNQGRRLYFYVCPGGYNLTTGTTTTKPSVNAGAVEYNISSDGERNNVWGMYNVDYNYGLHYMQSSDGQCTRAIFYNDGRVLMYFFVETPRDTVPAGNQWPNGSAIFSFLGVNTESNPDYGPDRGINSFSAYFTRNQAKTQFALGNTPLYFGSETIRSRSILDQYFWGGSSPSPSWLGPGDFTGEWPMLPIAVYSHDLDGARGRVGRLSDIWWGQRGVPTPAVYMSGGTRRMVQLTDMIYPWPDSTDVVMV